MITWPLDNVQYTANAIGAYCATRTRGVFAAENNFNVQAQGGFNLEVSEGLAWLKKSNFWGVAVLNEQNTTLSAQVGSGEANRYISVVLQLDKTANESKLLLKYAAYGAQAPEPVRDEFFDEIVLCHVLQRAGASEFTNGDITDKRLDEEVCGLVRDGITGIPTSEVNEQFLQKIKQLDAELKSVEDASGFMLNAVYDPSFQGINTTNQAYEHTALSTLSGTGANGYFIAAFSGEVTQITIGNDVFTVKLGGENSVNLAEGYLYTFFASEGIIHFSSDVKMLADAMPKTGGIFTGRVVVPTKSTTEEDVINSRVQNSFGTNIAGTSYVIFRRK